MRKKEDNQESIRLYFQNTTLKSVLSELSRASFCGRQSLLTGINHTSARVRF